MSFEIQNVLQGAEAYRNFDFNNHKDQKETPMVSFQEIGEIITKWSDSIFQKGFVKDYQFSRMSSQFPSELKKDDNLEQRMTCTAMNLHRITYQSLLNNKAPTKEDLAKVTKVFQEFAESIEGAANEQTRKEIVQISLHPRLAMLCSEMFVKHVADQVDEDNTLGYNIDDILYKALELHENDHDIAPAMREWGQVAFKPEFATKDGLAELEYGVKQPYCSYYKLSFEDSMNGAAKYLASMALKDQNGEGLTDAELNTVKEMFQDMLEHFENLNTGYLLHTPKQEAHKALVAAQEAYDNHVKESAERKVELTEAHAKAIADHQEAAAAQKGSLAELLATEVKTREEIVAAAKQQLDDTVTADEKKAEELNKALVEAKARFDELDNLAYRRGEVKEDLAKEISDETYEMIQRVRDNVPLAIICMQDYLDFAKARADREVKPDSSWFSGFRIW